MLRKHVPARPRSLLPVLLTALFVFPSLAPAQVEKELGFQIGGVGPFPVGEEVQVVVDEKLLGVGAIFCGSGVNTETVEIDLDILVRVAEARIAPISKQ